MSDWLTALVVAFGAVATVVLIVLLVRDEAAQDRTFGLLAVGEVVLLVQAVAGFVALAHTSRHVSGVLFSSYLAGVLLVLPIGAFWSLAERNRSGTGVLLVAVLAVLGMQLRLLAIWHGAAA